MHKFLTLGLMGICLLSSPLSYGARVSSSVDKHLAQRVAQIIASSQFIEETEVVDAPSANEQLAYQEFEKKMGVNTLKPSVDAQTINFYASNFETQNQPNLSNQSSTKVGRDELKALREKKAAKPNQNHQLALNENNAQPKAKSTNQSVKANPTQDAASTVKTNQSAQSTLENVNKSDSQVRPLVKKAPEENGLSPLAAKAQINPGESIRVIDEKNKVTPKTQKQRVKPIFSSNKKIDTENTSKKVINNKEIEQVKKTNKKPLYPQPVKSTVVNKKVNQNSKPLKEKINQQSSFNSNKDNLKYPNNSSSKPIKSVFSPYLGLSQTSRHIDYHIGEGGGIFTGTLNAPEISFGTKIWDLLGLEIGYSRGQPRRRNLNASEEFLGLNIPGFTFNLSSDARFTTLRFNTLEFIPLDKQRKLKLILGLGLSNTRMDFNYSVEGLDNVPADLAEEIFRGKFNKKRTVFNAQIGLEYQLMPHLAIQGLIRQDRLNDRDALENIFYIEDENLDTNLDTIVRLRNSLVYSVGFKIN